MAKPVPAEGPWRSFSVSLRESDLERLDAARGGLNRSEWARMVVLAALERQEPPAGSVDRTVRPAPKRGARADTGPGKVPHRCPVKGWCPECEEMKGGEKR